MKWPEESVLARADRLAGSIMTRMRLIDRRRCGHAASVQSYGISKSDRRTIINASQGQVRTARQAGEMIGDSRSLHLRPSAPSTRWKYSRLRNNIVHACRQPSNLSSRMVALVVTSRQHGAWSMLKQKRSRRDTILIYKCRFSRDHHCVWTPGWLGSRNSMVELMVYSQSRWLRKIDQHRDSLSCIAAAYKRACQPRVAPYHYDNVVLLIS